MGGARVKIYIAKKMKSWNLVEGHNLFIFALFGKLEQQFPKKRIGCIGGSWHSDIDLAVFFCVFQHSLPLKDDGIQLFSLTQYPYLEKSKNKEFHFQVLGLEESFLLFPSLTL